MKHLLAFLLLALSLGVAWPAEISIVVRNDAGTVVATETIKLDNAKLATIEAWRLKQFLEDGTTLKYLTRGALLKASMMAGLRAIFDVEPTAEMKTARDARVAAEAAEKVAREAALQ